MVCSVRFDRTIFVGCSPSSNRKSASISSILRNAKRADQKLIRVSVPNSGLAAYTRRAGDGFESPTICEWNRSFLSLFGKFSHVFFRCRISFITSANVRNIPETDSLIKCRRSRTPDDLRRSIPKRVTRSTPTSRLGEVALPPAEGPTERSNEILFSSTVYEDQRDTLMASS